MHEWAVDEKFLRGRHPIQGTVKQVTGQLLEYQRLGVDHIALEVSYSTYPGILETIDIIAEEVKPVLERGSVRSATGPRSGSSREARQVA